MAETDIENTQDSNAIGVVVQCPCSACGGCGMLPGTQPDDDVMNTPCLQCNPWAKAKTSTHEPAGAEPCGTCDGSGAVDSGGILPWGEPAMMECPECKYFSANDQVEAQPPAKNL